MVCAQTMTLGLNATFYDKLEGASRWHGISLKPGNEVRITCSHGRRSCFTNGPVKHPSHAQGRANRGEPKRSYHSVPLERSKKSLAGERFAADATGSTAMCVGQNRWSSDLLRRKTRVPNLYACVEICRPLILCVSQLTAPKNTYSSSFSHRVSSMPSSEEQYKPDRLRRRPTQLSHAPSAGSLAHISAPPASRDAIRRREIGIIFIANAYYCNRPSEARDVWGSGRSCLAEDTKKEANTTWLDGLAQSDCFELTRGVLPARPVPGSVTPGGGVPPPLGHPQAQVSHLPRRISSVSRATPTSCMAPLILSLCATYPLCP